MERIPDALDLLLVSEDDESEVESAANLPQPANSAKDVDDLMNVDLPTDAKKYEAPIELSPRQLMSSLRLRRIVRENHGGTINQCAFYRGHGTGIAPDFHPQNLLVTVGAAQVNIYDNAHCGDHLDIMSHYVVDGRGYFADAPEGPAPELLTCCWIHQPEDAVVATAGSDNLIRLISLARSEEICILEGHSGPILDIKVHPLDSNLLLSVSTDGTVRLWHLEAQKCLYTYQVMATTVAFHPNGLSFLTANAKGVIVDWEIPDEVIDMSEEQARGYATESIETGQMVTWADKLHGNHDIDCIAYVNDNVLSKSINGKVVFWNPLTTEVIHTYSISESGGNNRCRFDISACGTLFCVGNTTGNVYIYDLTSGKVLSFLDHRRSTKAVKCCVFSHDCRNVIYVGDDALVWRFDYVSEEVVREWEDQVESD